MYSEFNGAQKQGWMTLQNTLEFMKLFLRKDDTWTENINKEKRRQRKKLNYRTKHSMFAFCYCGIYIITFLLCSDKFSILYPEYIFSNTIMIVWMASFSFRMSPNFLEGFQSPMKLCEVWSLRYLWIYVLFNYSQPLSKVITQPFFLWRNANSWLHK